MARANRTATPMADWRTFRYTCDSSGGHENDFDGLANDALGARRPYLYLVESTVGVALYTIANNADGILMYAAEKCIVLKKTGSGEIFTPGMRVYWDPADRLVTPVYNSGYYWIGICVQAADAGDLQVMIDLMGNHAEVEAELP
ncbi:MAG: DUF2190 family protein [Candidatus Hodarchaeota archaeon]